MYGVLSSCENCATGIASRCMPCCCRLDLEWKPTLPRPRTDRGINDDHTATTTTTSPPTTTNDDSTSPSLPPRSDGTVSKVGLTRRRITCLLQGMPPSSRLQIWYGSNLPFARDLWEFADAFYSWHAPELWVDLRRGRAPIARFWRRLCRIWRSSVARGRSGNQLCADLCSLCCDIDCPTNRTRPSPGHEVCQSTLTPEHRCSTADDELSFPAYKDSAHDPLARAHLASFYLQTRLGKSTRRGTAGLTGQIVEVTTTSGPTGASFGCESITTSSRRASFWTAAPCRTLLLHRHHSRSCEFEWPFHLTNHHDWKAIDDWTWQSERRGLPTIADSRQEPHYDSAIASHRDCDRCASATVPSNNLIAPCRMRLKIRTPVYA
jgi:hypothetical protein